MQEMMDIQLVNQRREELLREAELNRQAKSFAGCRQGACRTQISSGMGDEVVRRTSPQTSSDLEECRLGMEEVGKSSSPEDRESRGLRPMAGANLKVAFLQYPFTLAIGFLDSYGMLRTDSTRLWEEQLTMANGDNADASGTFAS
jgi:hypothetical protein